jgi:putative phosphoribosyl transferase
MCSWWCGAPAPRDRPSLPLERRRRLTGRRCCENGLTSSEHTILIPLDAHAAVDGDLVVPADAVGVVVFAHGSGSGRRSARNRLVATTLQRRGLATLLIDLLTRDEGFAEAQGGHLRFDVDMLATRLLAARQATAQRPELAALPVGYFGASTGAAAALVAAATEADKIGAVVSRSGRPDLAGDDLPLVRAPTLLIVGSRDQVVLDLNKTACDLMTVERRLEIIPGATHLFEEPGTLEQASTLAANWFVRHLAARHSAP